MGLVMQQRFRSFPGTTVVDQTVQPACLPPPPPPPPQVGAHFSSLTAAEQICCLQTLLSVQALLLLLLLRTRGSRAAYEVGLVGGKKTDGGLGGLEGRGDLTHDMNVIWIAICVD